MGHPLDAISQALSYTRHGSLWGPIRAEHAPHTFLLVGVLKVIKPLGDFHAVDTYDLTS